MTITRGKQPGGIKMVIYGPEGVGKSTFAAQGPDTVFIDTEGSTRHMDVARVDGISGWADIMQAVEYFTAHPEELKTLAIDTIDWAERMAADDVCTEKHWKSLEDAGYGKGYVFLKQKIQELLDALTALVKKGVNVILIAHCIIRKFEQPDEMGAYDRYMLKLNEKNVMPLVREWADIVLFANYKTDVVKDSDGKTMKGRGGKKRVMYANHSAAFDAKNRFGLPDELAFEYDRLTEILSAAKPASEPVKRQTIEDVLNTAPIEMPEDASVTIVPELPKAGKKKNKPEPAERPADMVSDNPEKDKLLAQLWELMKKAAISDPLIIRAVVAEKEYYDLTTEIRDYDTEFIEGCLIEAWDKVNDLAQTKIHNLPF